MVSQRWKLQFLMLAVLFVSAYGNRQPDFEALKSDSRSYVRIGGCGFQQSTEEERKVFTTRGGCPFHTVLTQLFPNVQLNTITNEFMPAEKFTIDQFSYGSCSNGEHCEKDVKFELTGRESLEIRPQYFTLGSYSKATVSWTYNRAPTFQNVLLTYQGHSSLDTERVSVKLWKDKESEYFGMRIYVLDGSQVRLNAFLNSFGIEASDLIGGTQLSHVRDAFRVQNLRVGTREIYGVFSPGEGFELTLSGSVKDDAYGFLHGKQLYAIVKDFKKSTLGVGETERSFAKPIGAVFFLFERSGANVQDILLDLAGLDAPPLSIFTGVNEVALTAATNDIIIISNQSMHNAISKFIPAKGLKTIEKGLHVLHYVENSNSNIKDQDGKMKRLVLFHCEITNEKLSWKTPEYIQTTVSEMAAMTLNKPLTNIVLRPATKVAYDSIDILNGNEKDLLVNFNLTDPVPVLKNKLVSLLNATMTLKSMRSEGGQYGEWELAGSGREVILDELTNVTIVQEDGKTMVRANANIFSMTTLRNRTRATYLHEKLAKRFPYAIDFPLKEMRYECSFQQNKVLRLTGKLATPKEPAIELLYFLKSGPRLKLAILFENEYLHNVVNTFYGEEKIRTTWMKFQKIAILLMTKDKKLVTFDREEFKDLDNYSNKQFRKKGGISILARNFILSECDEGAKLCNFLKVQRYFANKKHKAPIDIIDYHGSLGAKKLEMVASTSSSYEILLSDTLTFGGPVGYKLSSKENGIGERQVLSGEVHFNFFQERYPGKIYDDGTNVLTFQFGGKGYRSSVLIPGDFVTLDPLHSKTILPKKFVLWGVELQSRLHLGTVKGSTITFSGGSCRQYINLYYTRQVLFVGDRNRLTVRAIINAFDIRGAPPRLADARFLNQVVVGYNSYSGDWTAHDFGVIVKPGLHFYGKLTLNDNEVYNATLSLTGSRKDELEAAMELPPLRYGSTTTDDEGKSNFSHVNLFLFKEAERPETGPTLYLDREGERIKGYCQTVGMQGEFDSRDLGRESDGRLRIRLSGSLYNEVDNAEVILSTRPVGDPQDFAFRYEVDIREQVEQNIVEAFHDVLNGIKKHIREGRNNATKVKRTVSELYEAHLERRDKYRRESENIAREIVKANRRVDSDITHISSDCIEKCRTVPMPGIDWRENCAREPGRSRHRMGCMVWNEEKEKAVNVICLLKCEADKYHASGSARTQLANVKMLVKRYKETYTMHQNENKILVALEEMRTMAADTYQMIEDSTNFESAIDSLLRRRLTEKIFILTTCKVDEDINDLNPPCLPFRLSFRILASTQIAKEGTYNVCFNGEFYQNMANKMLKIAFGEIDQLYQVLEEAELRYAQIQGLKRSLNKVMEGIEKNIKVPAEASSQRSKTEQPETEDPAMRAFVRYSKRALPRFAAMNDKTQMGFEHYSPWAIARRAQVSYSINKKPARKGVYNMTAFAGHSDCTKARRVIENYKDVAKGLRTINDHFEEGKTVFDNTKDHFNKELKESYDYLIASSNKTNLLPADKENMMYWYRYTEAGLKDYFETYSSQLDEHNKRGLESWRSDISSFFDQGRLFNELHQIGHQAYSRFNIPNKEAHVRSFNDVGQTMQQVLSQPGITLEQAQLMVSSIDPQINNLHKSTFSCY